MILIAGIALGCYAHTGGFEFVYDDDVQVALNQRIRSFSNLPQAFSENFWAFNAPSSFTNYYRPLHTITYMAGYALGGLSPPTYHWINILLHVVTCLSVYWLGNRILRDAWISFWGALVFATHPMHSENVAWIAGVTDLGCALFYFISLGAYLKYREDVPRRSSWLAVSLLSFFAALLYKEMAFTLPLAVALAEILCVARKPGASWISSWKHWLPFLPVLGIYLALRIHALGTFARMAIDIPFGVAERGLTMIYFVGRYLQDLIIPIQHNAYHVFRPFSQLKPLEWGSSFLILACWTGFVSWLWKRDKRTAFPAAFTVLALLPVLNLGGTGQNMYTERYLYIPSFGFSLAAVAAGFRAVRNRTAAHVLAGLLVTLLGVRSVVQSSIWKDNKTLYASILEVSPDAALIHNNLGNIYFSERNLEAAGREFQAGLDADSRMFVRSKSDRTHSLLGLSSVSDAEGKPDTARRLAEEARSLSPTSSAAHQMLGMLAGKAGDYAEAEGHLRRALELQPANAMARVNLGNLLLIRNDLAGAEREFRTAASLDPLRPGPRVSLGLLLLQQGRHAEAAGTLREALRLDPENPHARKALQVIESNSGVRK